MEHGELERAEQIMSGLMRLVRYAHDKDEFIETMLREMDEAIVIIYDSPLTPIPLQMRAEWIRRLYPAALRSHGGTA